MTIFNHQGLALAMIFGLVASCSQTQSSNTPDSDIADAGTNSSMDAAISPDSETRADGSVRADAALNATDATTPDAGFNRFPEEAVLRSAAAGNYREPLAITSDPREAGAAFFTAFTAAGEPAIFRLRADDEVELVFEGAPLGFPVDLQVNPAGRLLYITDIVSNGTGEVYIYDLRLETLAPMAQLQDLSGPAGVAFDTATPAVLITGRLPESNIGGLWQYIEGDMFPTLIPLEETFSTNDPSHFLWSPTNRVIYLYDSHFEPTQKGRVYQINDDGTFTVVYDNIPSNYPAGIDMALDLSYLLVSTSTPGIDGGDTLHVVEISANPPNIYPLVLPQKFREPRDVHRIPNSNRWFVIDRRGGTENSGAIYELR
ncbi:MAG: hypothetical protein VYC39_12470 [Myxococcota bacterium]|nr:hypothetical protein [Myxococcota bacterium]